jgi:hypothetical protein
MSREAALRQPKGRSAGLHILPGAIAKRGVGQAGLTAICHELAERLTAAGNYLDAVSRLREIEPAAAFASQAGEILEKARGQLGEGSRALRQLRGLLSGKYAEETAAACWAPKAPNSAYRVRFLNEFARAGSVLRVCQRTIIIRSARSPGRAVEAAKKRFARLERIRHWRIHAQTVELEVLVDDPYGC